MNAVFVAAAFLVASTGFACAEAVYRYMQGPSTICGLHASDTRDFLRQVEATAGVRRAPASPRFELFVSDDGLTQWVFTTPSEAAYPAVTCRRVYRDSQGDWISSRNLRCEADRTACDRLSTEFQQLDEQLKRSLAIGK